MPDPGSGSNGLDSSLIRPIINIVLPLPGSPFIQSSRESSFSSQRRKYLSLSIHAYESFSKLSLLASILVLSIRESVDKSRRHWLFWASWSTTKFMRQESASREFNSAERYDRQSSKASWIMRQKLADLSSCARHLGEFKHRETYCRWCGDSHHFVAVVRDLVLGITLHIHLIMFSGRQEWLPWSIESRQEQLAIEREKMSYLHPKMLAPQACYTGSLLG